MNSHPQIREVVEQTPLVDTHEHLIEESRRLAGPRADDWLYPCNDWAYLFKHYAGDDLVSAGFPASHAERFWSPDVEPAEKWRLFAPFWPAVRHTGYCRAVRLTASGLFGEAEIDEAACERITERMRAATRPGFYRSIIRDASNIESCQVNSLEHIFCETALPDLLYQDLSFWSMSTCTHRPGLEKASGQSLHNLVDWHRMIDGFFDRYGRKAIAVKNQVAYQRRLDFTPVSDAEAAPLCEKACQDHTRLTADEITRLNNHLFRYCVERATDYRLPVKLHTGYYAGTNGMPLERVRKNPSDLCGLLRDFPRTSFVIMHIGYPYQDEMIALAKNYTNAYVDLCWAWIINPAACVRFVKEFLMAAPCSKLFTFGGDYYSVETVYGHSQIARQGIAQALNELVDEGWMTVAEATDVAIKIMRENARALFRIDEKEKQVS